MSTAQPWHCRSMGECRSETWVNVPSVNTGPAYAGLFFNCSRCACLWENSLPSMGNPSHLGLVVANLGFKHFNDTVPTIDGIDSYGQICHRLRAETIQHLLVLFIADA